jgi:hypothetical protein
LFSEVARSGRKASGRAAASSRQAEQDRLPGLKPVARRARTRAGCACPPHGHDRSHPGVGEKSRCPGRHAGEPGL